MKKRISHNKSRNGCQNCKKRHVKCDEQGPPCAACIARDFTSTCSYKTSPPAQDAGSSVVSTSTSNSETQNSTPIVKKHTFDSRRLLELELMHRWSTKTYESLCSVPEDYHYLQIEVPRGALRHDFLLHGVFAITALEMALSGDPAKSPEYICIAMEYYDWASESFRAALCSVTSENQHYLYIFAIAATIINLAMPDENGNHLGGMLKRMVVLFELLMGACSIAVLNFNWMLDSPFSPSLLSALSLMEKPAPEPISEATKQAFEDLTSIIDKLGKDEESRSHAAYKAVATKLHYCFKQESRGLIRGFCIAFPVLAGEEYTAAMRVQEPMALFMLMYWGVLLNVLSDQAWWTAHIGRDLVSEISDALLQLPPQSQFSTMPEWNAGISWARTEVGLEVFD
ncbi:uncharacterized protein LY89DRAFT_740625 [Mollisia scopiformis]|uniref:Zn(2)-C6 fungal-type domain-containing protein n=1 Tax=Mollisia scopiformis TaxID=149040 RepID=A0A132BAU7_MOLSC|nr:uncharacterized protein LY89DRAFT_740625 [Mollisia scopiformis]KUJ09540.1 hypothetical protein LY89DRAFT_740625 [Mollisia scopiformis]